MCKIGVLHLSDLHLTSNQDDLDSKDLRKIQNHLIEAINDIKKNNRIDVVAVTGDIINKGKVNEYSFVEGFFRDLSEKTRLSLDKFIFAAGNHDVQREDFLQQVNIDKINGYTSFKNHFLGRFNYFCDFYKKLTEDEGCISQESYGIKDFEINKQIIRFIVLNSSLCSCSNQDFMKLMLSKYQLENIEEQIRNSDNTPILTIALMHHPIQWLECGEQELLLEYFEDEFKVNILLHGHTHEGRVYGSMDLDRTLINFVTGIGYDSNGEGKYKKLKYRIAYYQFDTDKNVIDGKLLVTNDKYKFVPDLSKYRKINVDGYFSLGYPLNNINKLNLYNRYINPYESKNVQINKDLIEKVHNLEKMIYGGKKYIINRARIRFNTKARKYELKFEKKYEILEDESFWYSGQFYGNKYKNNPKKSKEFYDKNNIKWEDLNFKAFVRVLNAKNEIIQNRVAVVVECVAESSNYKTYNIKYINKKINTNLNVHKGDFIELEYSYEIPVHYWGSYLNRTISYFEEQGSIIVSCDDEEKLDSQDFVLAKSDKVQISNNDDFILQRDGSFLINLPRECGKYTLYWDAKKIFGLEEDNTIPSRDECQITNT
jgi:Predicted phosphohydrolases